MFDMVAGFQRDIYLRLADELRAFETDGGWGSLLAFLPLAVAFGAAHALMPGHGKSILATYLAGSAAGLARAVAVATALAATHVGMSVAIALLALPLVSHALGEAGRAPLLEDLSRGLIALIGAWMVWRAAAGAAHRHDRRQGLAVGVTAGLVPCPLTLFVMTFAVSRGVATGGVAFALGLVGGIALTLAAVAVGTVLLRRRAVALLERRMHHLDAGSRALQAAAGGLMLLYGLLELVRP